MPALIHFGRKWLLACDDLVIPYAIEAVLRLIWLCACLVMLYLDLTDFTNCIYVRCFLYAFLGEGFITLCLCIGISVISSRGSVLQPEKRSSLSGVLYVKVLFVFFDVALASYLTWLLIYGPSLLYRWKIFCEATTVCLWGYVIAFILAIFISYNSLGSSKYWNNNRSFDSIRIFEKAEKIWRFRLKFFCFCADVSEEENDFIYVEISSFLTTFFSDIDLTPTDVLAGLIVLARKHAIERRRQNHQQIVSLNSLIESKPTPMWMTAENALYYLKVAKSTYGWLTFFDALRPWKLCALLTPKCLTSCSSNSKHGDCCNCNTSAFEQINGLLESDILYTSFSNSIHDPAFVVSLHHKMKSIVIAIRGSRSFSDVITGINAEEMNLPEEISCLTLKCHRGALCSALFIYRKMHELNLLKIAFNENPSYTLVLTGHSLGGSVAAILALLLQPQYPSLQCYSYAPLAVLCSEGVSKTNDFVFTVVVGDDMVSSLNVHSCKELFRQLYKSLEETQIPKYKLLTKAFKHYLKKSFKITPKTKYSSEIHENIIEVEEPIQHVEINMDQTHEAQLYAPGRILHLRRAESECDYSWVIGFSLQRIIISPHMIKDHQPGYIQHMLELYKSAVDSAETFSIRL